jgi:hypothetical protein
MDSIYFQNRKKRKNKEKQLPKNSGRVYLSTCPGWIEKIRGFEVWVLNEVS